MNLRDIAWLALHLGVIVVCVWTDQPGWIIGLNAALWCIFANIVSSLHLRDLKAHSEMLRSLHNDIAEILDDGDKP